MNKESYKAIVHSALVSAKIHDRVERGEAVVLERIARGGGATCWYHCKNKIDLGIIEGRLRPGGAVSFYFDCRFKIGQYSKEMQAYAEQILKNEREVQMGILAEDQIHFDVEIVTGLTELSEFVAGIAPKWLILCGPFPGRENDGINAISIVLPDHDGMVRPHPH